MNEPCLKCGEYHNRCFELKDLTDEEIIELWKKAIQDGYTDMIIHNSQTLDTKQTMFNFARAILRKAQEK